MTQLKTAEASMPNISERFSVLSSWISENFSAPWHAEPVGPRHPPASISWATADGVSISRAQMSPLRLVNPGADKKYSSKYYAYTANQTSLIKIEGRPLLRLQPGEMIILGSDTPCEYVMARDYETSSLVIDGDLFHQYVPNHAAILARRLNFPFSLDDILRRTMESAWAITCAGMFEEAGPRLIRSFLTMLALVPMPGTEEGHSTRTALDVRKMQVKLFIERNFARPDLSVVVIARQLQLSPRYVQKALAAEGLTPGDYLRSCRLKASARMLEDPALAQRSITQISFDCGFNSSAHFSTEFRRAFGASPREYRLSARGG
ncbi:MAG: helix-turn-helix transcriptional regulator [Gammaproteobacteria bacterium]|nr:helix-turn-helix transcriptional regulator [Gammaproteobacteria bacterium]